MHVTPVILCSSSGTRLWLAVLTARANGQDPILLVTAADQTVTDSAAFTAAVHQAIEAATDGTIVILGVTPIQPETSYGYIHALLRGAAEAIHLRPSYAAFQAIPSESIYYAVIQHCTGAKPIRMVLLNAGWSDLGAWDAVWQALLPKEAKGNAQMGDVITVSSHNTIAHASGRLVTLVGKVHRPCCWYESINESRRFKFKPGGSLRLQKQQHRVKHRTVVKGNALITNASQLFTLTENQPTYFPLCEVSQLANPGKQALKIIEVQLGNYLG